MHVSLPIFGDQLLMGSDRSASMGEEVTNGNNFSIIINTDNDEQTDRLFNGLSASGQITMPLQHMFWGARFGMFIDKFSVQWMVSQEVSQP